MKNAYIKTWFKDYWDIFCNEFKQILADEGVMIIFVVAGLIYPLLYNFVYYGGIINDTPVAVVDLASCKESRRFTREMDATREIRIAAKCMNMEEAKGLLQKRIVKGIVYFPADYGTKLARHEQAHISVYCDMSAFLYCKNDLIGSNMVMLHEIRELQLEDFKAKGLTDEAASQQVLPLGYEDNKPYNPQANYSFFLITAIMLIMIQQIMYYGMSVLTGTNREENRSFASLPDQLQGHGRVRIVLGRGTAYWLLFMGIGTYIAIISPAIFGHAQRGNFWDVFNMLALFMLDCVFFSMVWSTFITRRETVFVLLLVVPIVAFFLTGVAWPYYAFPKFWKYFSYIFPTTFGTKAYISLSVAGGDMSIAKEMIEYITWQTMIYFFFACACVHLENWVLHHKEELKEKRDDARRRRGIDIEGDIKMIEGENEI